MKKVPAKQIYLLSVIIVGIIALSVYSTYALFTFESTTGDIVSIHIPKSLTISENIYEYRQIKVSPNQVVTTDIDIYNAFEYDACYSVWYKVLGGQEIQNNVTVFEQNEKNLSSSGTIEANKHLRINMIIINDNDTEIKINIGTIGSSKQNESCSLNLSNDKHLISIAHSNVSLLTTNLLDNINTEQKQEGYLVHEVKDNYITINKEQVLYFSNEFTYTNEVFSLTDGLEQTMEEFVNQNILNPADKYFCMDGLTCTTLYQIKSFEIAEDTYNIRYNKLTGYLESETGLKKINDKDYVYIGDEPNNYIYYNCQNTDDPSSCELWRIVGLFHNPETDSYNIKIVRNDSIGLYQYDYKINNEENNSSNNWNESTLNKYLNEEYKIINGNNYITTYKQNLEIIPNLETDITKLKTDQTTDSKISILTLSDYLNASSCIKNKINEYDEICFKNNWLNNIENPFEWTMTAKEVEIPVIEEIEPVIPEPEKDNNLEENDQTNEEENVDDDDQAEEDNNNEITEEEPQEEINKYIINYVYSVNNNVKESDVNDTLSVRPVVYLKSRMLLISGDGSFNSPYIVK